MRRAIEGQLRLASRSPTRVETSSFNGGPFPSLGLPEPTHPRRDDLSRRPDDHHRHDDKAEPPTLDQSMDRWIDRLIRSTEPINLVVRGGPPKCGRPMGRRPKRRRQRRETNHHPATFPDGAPGLHQSQSHPHSIQTRCRRPPPRPRCHGGRGSSCAAGRGRPCSNSSSRRRAVVGAAAAGAATSWRGSSRWGSCTYAPPQQCQMACMNGHPPLTNPTRNPRTHPSIHRNSRRRYGAPHPPRSAHLLFLQAQRERGAAPQATAEAWRRCTEQERAAWVAKYVCRVCVFMYVALWDGA